MAKIKSRLLNFFLWAACLVVSFLVVNYYISYWNNAHAEVTPLPAEPMELPPNHPDIFTEELLMVRQLAPGQDGLPLEIYAFTKTIDVTVHEKIQADLFDHLFAIAAHFEIRMFQNPTGQDIKWVKDNSGGLDGIQRDDKLD